MKRVAFQGEPGAFSELAIAQCFGAARALPCRELGDVATTLLAGDADYALVPVENSIAGHVPGSAEIVGDRRFEVVDELWFPIHHCLLALSGATLTDLKAVLSHAIALAQCTQLFTNQPHLTAVAWYDTAGAARHVGHSGDATLAAIASEAAAERYGLEIVLRNVEDRADNRTRFVALQRASSHTANVGEK